MVGVSWHHYRDARLKFQPRDRFFCLQNFHGICFRYIDWCVISYQYLGIFILISNLNKTGVELFRMPEHSMWQFHILHSAQYNSVIYNSKQPMHSISLQYNATADTCLKFQFRSFQCTTRSATLYITVRRFGAVLLRVENVRPLLCTTVCSLMIGQ